MYGNRARIGYTSPPMITEVFPYEFYKMAPAGVTLMLTTLTLVTRSKDEVAKSFEMSLDAARKMAIINGVNADLARLDNGDDVRFLDINRVFLGQDGKIPLAIMPDQLHPNAAGYQLWADAMKAKLAEMMK